MRTIHKIAITSSPAIQSELKAIGISVPPNGFVGFEVAETDANWQSIVDWIRVRRPSDIAHSTFSKQEIDSADWLEMMPDWHHGYPEPDSDNFGFLSATYDMSNFCPECGVGLVQRAPFQMKAEPNWGKNSFLQLNWVFDEFFVRPEVWRDKLAPFGIRSKEVLNRKQEPLQTVLQLIVEGQTDIDVTGLTASKCSRCSRIKYLPSAVGRFPALLSIPSVPMTKSNCYFGSGHSARKAILVANQLRGALSGLKGFSVRPVTPGV